MHSFRSNRVGWFSEHSCLLTVNLGVRGKGLDLGQLKAYFVNDYFYCCCSPVLSWCNSIKLLEWQQGQIWLTVLKYFFVFDTHGCIYIQSNMSLITNISLCNGISSECIGHLAHKNNEGLIQSSLKSSTKLS